MKCIHVLASQLKFEITTTPNSLKPSIEDVLKLNLKTESLENFSICIAVEKESMVSFKVCLMRPGYCINLR